jgi:hypothetical protein
MNSPPRPSIKILMEKRSTKKNVSMETAITSQKTPKVARELRLTSRDQ